MNELAILKLFNAVLLEPNQRASSFNTDNAAKGFITDFQPTMGQLAVLQQFARPLAVNTMFTVEERENASIDELLSIQILHYIEVYGLGLTENEFNLVTKNGTTNVIRMVRGITKEELGEKVRKLLYSNAPVRDAAELVEIIRNNDLSYELNKIQNNEVRVLLFNPLDDTFDNGDDAVRWIVHATGAGSLLIKNDKVINQVREGRAKVPVIFLEDHINVLSQVFNRHKRIIMALKDKSNRTVINTITRRSKTNHVPIRESIAKTFISKALSGQISNVVSALANVSTRDLFKYLNLLEYKKQQNDIDAFVIRNGKIHIEPNRPIQALDNISRVESDVLLELERRLRGLRDKKIVLDRSVDYGLPISRKQTVGRLPFGTKARVDGDQMSYGIHWREVDGARDLDLSSIDIDGNRTGWGQYSGYDGRHGVTYSGDVTSAPGEGSMEFLTVNKGFDKSFGIFVNIFSGDENNTKASIVVGEKTDRHWIKDPVIREEFKLESRGSIVGFVINGVYTVYAGRLNNSRVSGGQQAIMNKATADQWTVRRLFDELNIDYSLDSVEIFDYNLQYNQFSYDKLEELLLTE